MALGSLVFGVGAARATTRRWQILFGLNFFICLIAAVLYLTMATGYGAVQIGPQRTVWVRYVTWILSTPLLILDLAYLGRSRLPLTGSLLGANTFMIATGFVATVVQSPYNLLWYGISSAAFHPTAGVVPCSRSISIWRAYPDFPSAEMVGLPGITLEQARAMTPRERLALQQKARAQMEGRLG